MKFKLPSLRCVAFIAFIVLPSQTTLYSFGSLYARVRYHKIKIDTFLFLCLEFFFQFDNSLRVDWMV